MDAANRGAVGMDFMCFSVEMNLAKSVAVTAVRSRPGVVQEKSRQRMDR
jgi:hypothetical protein